jgi:hypothetical protein
MPSYGVRRIGYEQSHVELSCEVHKAARIG